MPRFSFERLRPGKGASLVSYSQEKDRFAEAPPRRRAFPLVTAYLAALISLVSLVQPSQTSPWQSESYCPRSQGSQR